MMEILIGVLRRAEIPAAQGTTVRLEQKPIDGITKADVEAVRTWRRAELVAGKSRPGAKGGEAGINRLLSRMRHLFNWAIAKGYLLEMPFKRGPVTVVKIERSIEYARTRRLAADGIDEETRVLTHADPHLKAVLIAALTTRCRIGGCCPCNGGRFVETRRARPVGWSCLPPRRRPARPECYQSGSTFGLS
jgi:hypothetical protein